MDDEYDLYDNFPEQLPERPRRDYFLIGMAAAYLAVAAGVGFAVGRQCGIVQTERKYKDTEPCCNQERVIARQAPAQTPATNGFLNQPNTR